MSYSVVNKSLVENVLWNNLKFNEEIKERDNFGNTLKELILTRT